MYYKHNDFPFSISHQQEFVPIEEHHIHLSHFLFLFDVHFSTVSGFPLGRAPHPFVSHFLFLFDVHFTVSELEQKQSTIGIGIIDRHNLCPVHNYHH
jgi:hypothetical protein